VKDEDRRCFAAAAEVALSAGWRTLVVAGFRPQVMSTLDALSAQRRAMKDPVRLQERMLNLAGSHGP
jgi:hypothetical protein